MPDDLLKEQLMRYARDGAEEAFQPGPAEIRRRARRHYRRVAALTGTAVLLAGGIAVGVGLRGAGSVPTVQQPPPPATSPLHRVAPPESFVTVLHGGEGADSGDLAVVSRATGKLIRSLAPATNAFAFTVSHDRRWVYFHSTSPSAAIYRVPLAGGAVERVTTSAEPSVLAVSPDGSKLAWETQSGNRPALRVRDLARRTERVLRVPGPLSGPDTIGRGSWAWSPDSRQLAVQVVHGIATGYSELKTVDVATGKWRHRFNFEAKRGEPECCLTLEWPAGSRQPVVVQTIYHAGQQTRTYRLVYVDPATGAATPGAVLAVGDVYPSHFDFDPTGRYLLFGSQDTHTVSTWWSRGGKPVRVTRIEIGNEAPAGVAGAYVGGEW